MSDRELKIKASVRYVFRGNEVKMLRKLKKIKGLSQKQLVELAVKEYFETYEKLIGALEDVCPVNDSPTSWSLFVEGKTNQDFYDVLKNFQEEHKDD